MDFRHFPSKKGTFVLYIGGMIELFYSSPKEEVVFLKERKGPPSMQGTYYLCQDEASKWIDDDRWPSQMDRWPWQFTLFHLSRFVFPITGILGFWALAMHFFGFQGTDAQRCSASRGSWGSSSWPCGLVQMWCPSTCLGLSAAVGPFSIFTSLELTQPFFKNSSWICHWYPCIDGF